MHFFSYKQQIKKLVFLLHFHHKAGTISNNNFIPRSQSCRLTKYKNNLFCFYIWCLISQLPTSIQLYQRCSLIFFTAQRDAKLVKTCVLSLFAYSFHVGFKCNFTVNFVTWSWVSGLKKMFKLVVSSFALLILLCVTLINVHSWYDVMQFKKDFVFFFCFLL